MVSKKIFLALQASVWFKNKGGDQGPSPSPSPGSATATDFKQECGSGGSKFSNVWQKNLHFNIALVLDSKGTLIFLKHSTSPVESISL